MMDYSAVKSVHVAAVAVSYTLFTLRGIWMMQSPARLDATWVKTLPHVVDTILLGSAIVLAVILRQYPFDAPWLTAKVTGLVAYIVLGSFALKRGRTGRGRVRSWVAAQLVFFYIVAVATTKDPWPLG